MDKEAFYNLSMEQQDKLEKVALKNVFLEFSIKDYQEDERAVLTVRPMYRNPAGGEFRYYTDNYSMIKACGKHLFANLHVTGHVSKYGSRVSHITYNEFYYSINLERAKEMYTTLKWLERRVTEECNDLYPHQYGSAHSFTEYVVAVAIAIGAAGGLVYDPQNGHRLTYNDISDFIGSVEQIEQDFVAKYAEPKDEPVPEAVSNNERVEADG